MKYVDGFVVAVPANKRDAYREIATKAALLLKEFGVLRIVECQASDVPDGKVTDFRTAMRTEENGEAVFSWVGYPLKEVRGAVTRKMMPDSRMKEFGESIPFDDERIIYGGFESIIGGWAAWRAVRRVVSPKICKCCSAQHKKSSFGNALLQSQP